MAPVQGASGSHDWGWPLHRFFLCLKTVSVSGTRGFAHSHSYSVTSHLDYCIKHLDWRSSRNYSGSECSRTGKFGLLWFTHIVSLLCKMCWLPVSFWIEFKVIVSNFKALHGSELGYLWNFLSLRVSAHSTKSEGWPFPLLKDKSSPRTYCMC